MKYWRKLIINELHIVQELGYYLPKEGPVKLVDMVTTEDGQETIPKGVIWYGNYRKWTRDNSKRCDFKIMRLNEL